MNSDLSTQGLPLGVAALLDQIDSAFPEVTVSEKWKMMSDSEKRIARREFFRLLYGFSPEIYAMQLKNLRNKIRGRDVTT